MHLVGGADELQVMQRQDDGHPLPAQLDEHGGRQMVIDVVRMRDIGPHERDERADAARRLERIDRTRRACKFCNG